MEMPGTIVFARFKAKRGMEDHVRYALLEMLEPTLQEDANIGYMLHRSDEDPSLFLLYEQWRDDAGLQNHMGQPYFSQMESRLDGALEVPMEVIRARALGGETAPVAAGTPTV